jgi:hypothetical protein
MLQANSETSSEGPAKQPSAPHDRKGPLSERKIRANRENSRKSTGPKTERGKRTVSRNAIKHGILAREVVITSGDGKESLKEFHALIDRLSNHYEPVGVIEENLVQIIGNTLWKKARVVRAENGEIRRQLDTLRMDRAQEHLDKGNLEVATLRLGLYSYTSRNRADQKVPTRDRYSTVQATQRNLREYAQGRAYLAMLLKLAKSEIQSVGYISEQIRKKISSAFCLWDYIFEVVCNEVVPPPAGTKDQQSDKGVDQRNEAKRALAIAIIDDRLEELELFEKQALTREKLALEADARRFSLPSADATGKILRYEAQLDRLFHRAMDQLERLQRRRRGENVPPPLNVNLSRRA